MIRILLALACLVAAAPAAAAERRYAVTDFDRLVVEGPFIVRLVAGRPSAAIARGSREALDRASVDVSGQTLRIRRIRNRWTGSADSGAQQGPLEIELTTRTLRSVRVIGPARVELDRVEGLRVDLIVEGSGLLRASAVRADNLSLGLAGAGRIEAAGTAGTLVADIQGTGDVAAAGLRVQTANVTSATLGNVALHVVREATVSAFGLGTIEVGGRPACTVRGPQADLVRCGSDQRQQR